MGASVWGVGRTAKVILGEGCGGLDGGGQVSGEYDEQQKVG